MMKRAERRHIYDQLVLADNVDYLRTRHEPCDLVLAGDVFIYTGDLVAVFQAVAARLRPGGLFAFSLESAPHGDFVLQRNRRYAHSLSYIRRLARQTSFDLVSIHSVKLRRREEEHAESLIIVLRIAGSHES
jgi:predicted TPR repeat methyltransferase